MRIYLTRDMWDGIISPRVSVHNSVPIRHQAREDYVWASGEGNSNISVDDCIDAYGIAPSTHGAYVLVEYVQWRVVEG